ncbi:hypothetical protein AB0B39_04700 [Micromonospora sp. NPDC049114]|uniref:hypothetical protein n=1 Tax=unclassified Micromonospora TaxID=2617518 RepID=UPI0033CBF9DF
MDFPFHADSAAKEKLADLARLLDASLTSTQYIDGMAASRLLGTVLGAYRDGTGDHYTGNDPFLAKAAQDSQLFGLSLAAAFDLVTNAEYLHGRVVNSRWIYCHREGSSPRVYYSFLKQCPRCCLDKGLEGRLNGAQHKPTSHHIGEITTVATALLLQLVAAANEEPFQIATITKQSHDVDAIGYRDDLIVLFEIKASPMVTFPLVAVLPEPLLTDRDGEPAEYPQHALVDMNLAEVDLALYVPHRDWLVPLGKKRGGSWPYDELSSFFLEPGNFLEFLSAWIELYEAYRIPKTQRRDRNLRLAYLVNGWGDEIDSNKTKPGLGRTDDIKKGTYQLLKFSSYYRDDAAATKVRGALVANLDPLFLRADYVDKLADVRWARSDQFIPSGDNFLIRRESLRHLYDAILTFNQPVINDQHIAQIFDLGQVARALASGRLDKFLREWCSSGPDNVAEQVAQEGRLF